MHIYTYTYNILYIYIYIYICYPFIPSCFDSCDKEINNLTTALPNLPPENRELLLISKVAKIKNSFSLIRQPVANFRIYTKLSERFALVHTE